MNISPSIEDRLARLVSFDWLLRIISAGFQYSASLITFLDRLFEGEGGILWTILFLILLASFLIRVGGGG